MRRFASFAMLLCFAACTSHDPETLCKRFYSPYPDVVSQRQRTALNADLVDAMRLYKDRDFEGAIKGLDRVLERDARNSTARMYMASAQLGAGNPYKAEMHLDFLENYHDRAFKDQVEWYNALCWLCEGDTAKARKQAVWIASRPQTYRKQAAELAKALNKH